MNTKTLIALAVTAVAAYFIYKFAAKKVPA